MLGLKCRVPNADVVRAGYDARVLVVAAADNVVRLLPPLNLTEAEVDEGLRRLERGGGGGRGGGRVRHFLDLHTDARRTSCGRSSTRRAAMKAARGDAPKGVPDAEQPLAGRVVALVFEKPSTRTRVSFDVGIRQMGGETLVLSGAEMQLGHGETIADTARVLSRFVDAIMIRTFEESTLQELADNATVPVINGLTNASHPCQIMADVMTYEEHRGPIAGAKVVWSGDGNNVCASFLHAAGQFGFDLTFTGPAALDPAPAAVAFARGRGVTVAIERDPLQGGGRAPTSSSPTPGSRCTTARAPASAATRCCAPTRSTTR